MIDFLSCFNDKVSKAPNIKNVISSTICWVVKINECLHFTAIDQFIIFGQNL